jgi:hypothetical protein
MSTHVPRLSKTRFQAGLQCHKCLWLDCHAPWLADPVTEAKQAVFDQGHQVGALAREFFSGGVMVAEDHTQSEQALETTRRLLGEGTRCLYEGAFWHDGVLVRADVVFRGDPGGWTLVEVKSSTSVKPEHVSDLAIQAYVLRGAGLPVTSTRLLHLNNTYVYGGGPYDLGRLFTLVDLTSEVAAYLPQVPGLLLGMRRMLAGPVPELLIGRRCDSPYQCRYYGHCHRFLPEHPVTEIPRLSDELLTSLLANGYHSICDVPLDYPGLTPSQQSACYVARTGQPRFDPALEHALGELHEPLHFLDFETYNPALPLHAGTRPYQVLPVQWSCHTLDEGLRHAEFIHTDGSDPRRAFAESLLAVLGPAGAAGRGPIVVYTHYENTVLDSLGRDLPDLAGPLAALRARLFDLEKVIKAYVQHPEFHGRTSLKSVVPALVDDVSYQDLAVPNGEVAQLRWAEAVYGDIDDDERRAIFADLLGYCKTDTLALVRLYEELRSRCR